MKVKFPCKRTQQPAAIIPFPLTQKYQGVFSFKYLTDYSEKTQNENHPPSVFWPNGTVRVYPVCQVWTFTQVVITSGAHSNIWVVMVRVVHVMPSLFSWFGFFFFLTLSSGNLFSCFTLKVCLVFVVACTCIRFFLCVFKSCLSLFSLQACQLIYSSG